MIVSMTDDGPVARNRRPFDGPHAGVVALVALGFTLAAVFVPLALFGSALPGPGVAGAAYVDAHRAVPRIAGFFTFAASLPVGICTAASYARLLRLGVRVAGPVIALVGGISASLLLAVAGLLAWALGETTEPLSAGVLRLVTNGVFALGGVGFVGGLGLLVAGIAVPATILRLTPRWLAFFGLAVALGCEVSFFGLLWSGFDLLLPVGRFGGLAWLSVVGFLLPRNRHDLPAR
jgi:hypothetical protein